MKKSFLSFLTVTGFFTSIFTASAGNAIPLINVDLSNPSAAIFSSTGQSPLATDNTTFSSNGISLVNFFGETTGSGVQGLAPSSLQPLVAGTNFTLWSSDTYNGGPGLNINFFDATGTPQAFNPSNAAFTGSTVVDLLAYLNVLPGLNATGFIYAGNSAGPGNNSVLGFWQVIAVPEPTTAALALIGGTLIVFARRRR